MSARAQIAVAVLLVGVLVTAGVTVLADRAAQPTVAIVQGAAAGVGESLYTDDEIVLLEQSHTSPGAKVMISDGVRVSVLDTNGRRADVDLGVRQGLQPMTFSKVHVLEGTSAGTDGWIAQASLKPLR